jgi:osmoprotectant transport system ATP-binding protein
MSDVAIEVIGLCKSFIAGSMAVDQVCFQVPTASTLAIVGPSGCGKTTTLKMLNRLIEPTRGKVLIRGEDIMNRDPVSVRLQTGYVIQNGGLFPHWTVARNVAAVPRLLGWDRRRIKSRVNELLQMVGLSPQEFRGRFPTELSGGQQQRVGIARALAADPPVILLDEPFSALDPITRRQLQDEFLDLKQRVSKTQVLVTHDLSEAFRLSDQLLVMNEGRMVQCGRPEEIRSRPANDFVRQFLQSEVN